MSDYSDDFYYGPRESCDFEQELDCGYEPTPNPKDPVVIKFAEILTKNAENAFEAYDYVPEDSSLALVFCDPDGEMTGVNLYSVSNENIQFISKIASTLSKTTIYLPRHEASRR